MSETISSVDEFVDMDGEVDSDSDLELGEGSSTRKSFSIIDSRRRLEERLAERKLEKDIQEFDFGY